MLTDEQLYDRYFSGERQVAEQLVERYGWLFQIIALKHIFIKQLVICLFRQENFYKKTFLVKGFSIS
ncbi:MAG: hypothetical protein MRZ74_00330 [Blautia sp.]|nr:hypothetical protein [Blautia sp.]MDY5032431.1 hypothetical protein [Blautia sp.]